jgi:hypothetical protein
MKVSGATSSNTQDAGYTRLNICLQGYDKVHSPKFLDERDRGDGPETLAKDLIYRIERREG